MEVWASTVPLLEAGLWAGTGHGTTAVLVSQADPGSGAQALQRARKALPRLLAWFPVISGLAAPGVSAGKGGSYAASPQCPATAFLCAWTLGPL